ncbi:MAG: class II glutamine amidotransferase [Methylobacteriaceae bacterium]|nr:class II glutamine amidotransferase [Methylobacteriaceae bacterium]
MCELLGMSANVPTDIRFSFAGLARRGGDTGPHRDGWGISFYEGKASRSFHDPQPSAHSDVARLIRNYPIKSLLVIAHVRRANRGRVGLENTHPFSRELWGRSFVLAHNGQLKGIKKWPTGSFRPIGTTDSEHAFCWMLDQLRNSSPALPFVARLDKTVGELCRRLGQLGVFNMLMSDGRSLYCFCSRRLCYVTRRAPFGTATLIDEDLRVDFAKETTPSDIVSVVATRPLTRDETWTEVPRGSLIAFWAGEVVVR